MKSSHLFALAAGVLLVACNGTTETTDTEPTTTTSETDTDTTTNETGATTSTGTETSQNKADYEALAACGTSACTEGFAQWIEGEQPFTIHSMECLVEAMRDRTPGVYLAELDHTNAGGSEFSHHVLVVTASGEVALGIYRVESYDVTEESWEPTRRCTLKPATFFEDCLAALATFGEPGGEDPFPFIYPAVDDQNLPWFESCEDEAPACE